MSSLADDLRELRALKDTAEEDGRDKEAADAEFKQHMAKCLDRMEAEEAASFRTPGEGYLFSRVDRVKGQIEDRAPYVRWALENDEGIVAFLNTWAYDREDVPLGQFEADFYDAIIGTSTVSYKEDGHIINAQARAHIDDKAPLPPGLTFLAGRRSSVMSAGRQTRCCLATWSGSA